MSKNTNSPINYLDLLKFIERLIEKRDRPVTASDITKAYAKVLGKDLEVPRMAVAVRKLAQSSTNLVERAGMDGSVSYDTMTRKIHLITA